MDNHMKDMGDMYEQMLKEGTEKSSSVNTKVKAGDSFEGADKTKKMSAESGPDGKSNTVAKPAAGPSAGDDDVAKGKGKPLSKKEVTTKDSVDNQPKISLSFDDLYNKVIKEGDGLDEVVPTQDIESGDFDENTGDFSASEETDVDEEIDLASELRLLSDRLNEIADKLSLDDTESPDVSEDMGETDETDGISSDNSELAPDISKESVHTEAIKSEPNPKPLKKTTLGPKTTQNPKNKIGKSGAGKASTPAGKDRSGTPSNAPKTQFGPKMSQNPSGTGPAVKGGQAAFVA
jgi:hypothetical protein